LTLAPVANGKNLQSSGLIILFRHLWEVELTYRYIFSFKFTLLSQQPNIVPIISHRCCCTIGKLPPVSLTPAANLLPASLTPVANLPPVSTTLAKLVAKFAAGVLDTDGAP
jgi:hypothetical protein